MRRETKPIYCFCNIKLNVSQKNAHTEAISGSSGSSLKRFKCKTNLWNEKFLRNVSHGLLQKSHFLGIFKIWKRKQKTKVDLFSPFNEL